MIRMHPGVVLRNTLEDMGIRSKELAERYGCDDTYISQILSGKKPLTKTIAKKLEPILGISAKYWMNVVLNYELSRDAITDKLDNNEIASILNNYQVNELRKKNYIFSLSQKKDKLMELLQFFAVDSISDIPPVPKNASFRITQLSQSQNIKGKIKSWIRMVEIEASEIRTNDYNKDLFLKALNQIREDMSYIDFTKETIQNYLREKLKESGVVFVLVDQIQGAGIWGYVYRDDDRMVLGQTDRYKDDGQFWFTFFHEAGHILNDLEEERTHLDFGDDNCDDEKEKKANEYARKILIPDNALKNFKRRKISEKQVVDTALSLKLPLGVLVGRLQFEELLERNQLNGLKRSFK